MWESELACEVAPRNAVDRSIAGVAVLLRDGGSAAVQGELPEQHDDAGNMGGQRSDGFADEHGDA